MNSTGRFTRKLRKLVHYGHDTCSECGTRLSDSHPAYAGYTSGQKEIYVGDCCKQQISELASHIYWWWENYKRPALNTPLWRYMDFAKFVAMLANKSIYFARPDLLGDPFEGARGLVSKQPEWKAYSLEYLENAIRTAPGGANNRSDEEIRQEAERLFSDIRRVDETEFKRTFVSCWHASDVESEALWRLYCPPGSVGVAVQTERGVLEDSLDQELTIKFGHVRYIDFSRGFAGTYDRIFWKRKSLSHEAEVRGVVQKDWMDKRDIPGIAVSADLNRGIQKVVISPFAPSWFMPIADTACIVLKVISRRNDHALLFKHTAVQMKYHVILQQMFGLQVIRQVVSSAHL